jgi:1-acyl-sn-glycerol-3-phosphate acyltransferase
MQKAQAQIDTKDLSPKVTKKEEVDFYTPIHAFSHQIAIGLVTMYLNLRYKVTIEGQENIPTQKSFIVASNHFSYIDPAIVSMAVRQPIAYLAKQELFAGHGKFFGSLITFLGAVPLNREKPSPSTLKLVKKILLEKKWPLGIFIEGTRNLSRQKLGKLEQGAAFISKLCKGATVLPVGIEGGQNPGDKLFVRIGKAIEYQESLTGEQMTTLYGRAIALLAKLEFEEDY